MIIRAQQALHLPGLEPVAERRADPHSYGFRWDRGTQMTSRACLTRWLGKTPRHAFSRGLYEGFHSIGCDPLREDLPRHLRHPEIGQVP